MGASLRALNGEGNRQSEADDDVEPMMGRQDVAVAFEPAAHPPGVVAVAVIDEPPARIVADLRLAPVVVATRAGIVVVIAAAARVPDAVVPVVVMDAGIAPAPR